jgi:hypothetical protein
VEALDGDGGDHLALIEVCECCSAVWWFGEMGWVGLLEACEEVDLSECELDGYSSSVQ